MVKDFRNWLNYLTSEKVLEKAGVPFHQKVQGMMVEFSQGIGNLAGCSPPGIFDDDGNCICPNGEIYDEKFNLFMRGFRAIPVPPKHEG